MSLSIFIKEEVTISYSV